VSLLNAQILKATASVPFLLCCSIFLICFWFLPPLTLNWIYILFLNILTGFYFVFDLDWVWFLTIRILESCVSSVSFVFSFLNISFLFLVLRFVVLLYLLFGVWFFLSSGLLLFLLQLLLIYFLVFGFTDISLVFEFLLNGFVVLLYLLFGVF